jgi:hypothetical protein
MSLSGETLHSISAPDRLDSRVGTLESVDGVPSGETAELVYDHLDFLHALNVYSTASREHRHTRCGRAFMRRERRTTRS